MTAPDELNRLRAALHRAAPPPDPARRAASLQATMEGFDRHRAVGLAGHPAKAPRRLVGLFAAMQRLRDRLTRPAALGVGASVAVAGLAFLAVMPQPQDPGVAPMPQRSVEMAPVPEATPTPALPDSAAAPVASRPAAPASLSRKALPAAPQAIGAAPPVMDAGADRFARVDPNPVTVVAEQPVSTFSVDVDTASWSWVRASLRLGQRPEPASVRLEEMVNYFTYAYPAPDAGAAPFRPSVAVVQTPWNPDTRLVRIGLQGRHLPVDARPPLNLVFLIDTSGSMAGPDRLGLLKYAFRQLLGNLGERDRVAIVAYAGSAGEVLPPTAASDRQAILAALDSLRAGGSTAGGEGLELAYSIAARMGGKGAVNRVVLATDGDFNIGPSDPAALADAVAAKRAAGISLSVLGFGRGNLNDELMQALAQNGNGVAAYIDSASEARKALVEQAAGALFPVADDVKVQVEWNPAVVAEYRLLGYETRALARADFGDDRVDAGDIGAGHQVTALYEITPLGSPARVTDPLRYGQAPDAGARDESGWLRLRYKAPGESVSALIEAPVPAATTEPDTDTRFAAAIAGFAQLLTGGRHLGNWGWAEALALADGARGDDPFGYRAEAIDLMRIARDLSE